MSRTTIGLVLAGSALASMLSMQTAEAQFGGGFGGRDQDIELVDRFDANGDGWLNAEERAAAIGSASTQFRGRFRGGGSGGSTQAGIELSPGDVETYSDESLYDPDVLRTIFIDFGYAEWERELEAFHGSDVDIPATVIVDGERYEDVGIHFRGNTSYSSVSSGFKRPLNLSFDFINEEQNLLGYDTLNLLNGMGDPTFMRNVLYVRIANEYYPTPRANFVRVVINGEDWGIYVNLQQFNTQFTREVGDSNEARWRVAGSFNSRGGLEYLGDSIAAYERQYDIKRKDEPESWEALIELTRVLNQTPIEDLQAALEPILDIDGALRFLAVDNALLNSDGYWSRNSDYSIWIDEEERFHITAYDANEALREVQTRGGFGGFGGGFGGGGGGGGVELSPLVAMGDRSKALYRLLEVPQLRAQYLSYVRDIAENWLSWDRIEAIIDDYHALIGDAIAADTKKLFSTSAFTAALTDPSAGGFGGGPGASPRMSLKATIEARQAWLLSWLEEYEAAP